MTKIVQKKVLHEDVSLRDVVQKVGSVTKVLQEDVLVINVLQKDVSSDSVTEVPQNTPL